MRATTPLRTTADLLRKQWRPYALASTDAMANAGLVRPMDVRAYLADLKGYRGIRQARVLARYIEPKAASPGESWTRLRLIDAGFPVPRAQVEVIDAAGLLRYLDLAYVKRRVAVEFDGREFHTSDDDLGHDHDRHELVVAIGYRIVRARYEDPVRQGQCIRARGRRAARHDAHRPLVVTPHPGLRDSSPGTG
jgi:hypothetical protein